MKRDWPVVRGLRMDPLADLALPMLLLLFTAVAIQVAAVAARGITDQPLLPLAGFWALVVAAESYLFTTFFFVRDLDRPWMLRWAEAGVMMFLDWLLAAVPLTGGVAAAFLYGTAHWEAWVGAGLLLFAWLQGARLATIVGPLHPGLAEAQAAAERLPHDDHSQALAALRTLLLVQVAVLAALVGLTGGGAAGPVALMALAAGALLIGARLKQAVTWGLERVTPSPAVAARWIPQGLALLILPVLLALLLPAGPRIPAERLLFWGGREEPRYVEPPRVEMPDLKGPQIPWEEGGEPQPFKAALWVTAVLKWVLAAAAAAALLAFLAAAARQLSDRVGKEQLKGAWAVLAAVAAWYAALWLALRELLGGVLRQAAAVPAETLGALLAQGGGVLARYIPALGRAPGEPRAALRWYFGRLQRDAGRQGLRRRPGETAAEFAARLAGAAPEEAAAVLELRDAYQIARYTDEPIGPERVSFARRAWLQIARALGRRG